VVTWGTFVLDGGAMFGIIPRPLWEKLIPPDERNGIRLALRSMLVQAPGKNVLVDCGIWDGFPEKLRTRIYSIDQPDFASTLKAQAGLDPSEITDVIATHLHFDHVGGFFSSGGRSRFPQASLHIQKGQLAWAKSPSDKDRGSYVPEMIAALEAYPKLVVHDGAWALVPGLDVELAHGHTPFMQIVKVTSGARTIIHTADMIPTSAHVPTPYIMGYDNEPLVTAREKKALFARFPDAVYFFMHDPTAATWTIDVSGADARRGEPLAP